MSVLGGSAAQHRVPMLKQTEIDFGTTPLAEYEFTIVDNDVQSDSLIMARVSYDTPTDKDQDELTMDDLDLKCEAFGGYFVMYARGRDGYVADKFKIDYLVG